LDLVTEKWDEWRSIIDDDVDASGKRPWVDIVEKMIAKGTGLNGAWVKEVGKRNHDGGCKERNQQDGRTGDGEPSGRQTREQQNEEFVARDGQPVDKDVQAVRGGAPLGYSKYGMEDNHDD
jgi:hypothetical protein